MDMSNGSGMSAMLMYDNEGRIIEYCIEDVEVKEKRFPRRYYVYAVSYNTVIIVCARSVTDSKIIAERYGYITIGNSGVYNEQKPLRCILDNYKGEKIGVGIFLLKDVKTGIRKILLGV
jgi:hypothetical protein